MCLRSVLSLLIAGSICLLSFTSPAPRAVDQFGWLTGSWKRVSSQQEQWEEWHVANDSTLQGRSYQVRNGTDTLLLETVQLTYRGGHWAYCPTVADQNNGQTVVFPLIWLGKNEFIAVNSSHDFPQRIQYRRQADWLLASIEGEAKNGFRKVNFDFIREK